MANHENHEGGRTVTRGGVRSTAGSETGKQGKKERDIRLCHFMIESLLAPSRRLFLVKTSH